MGKSARLFGKIDNNSTARHEGAFMTAEEIPFRPHQCANCNFYLKEIERCEAFSRSTAVGKMSAMFSGESREDCSRFEPAIKIDVEKSKELKDVQELIRALHSMDFSLYAKANAALKEIGKPAVEALVSELEKDKDSTFRYRVAIILGNIGDSRAIESLVNSIKTDPVQDVRWHAVDSLGKIGGAGAAGALEQLLADKDIYVQNVAKEALEKIKAKKEKE
jgi:HEAT repeat protein